MNGQERAGPCSPEGGHVENCHPHRGEGAGAREGGPPLRGRQLRRTWWSPRAGINPFTASPGRSGCPKNESVNGKREAAKLRLSTPRPLPAEGGRLGVTRAGAGPCGGVRWGRESGWRQHYLYGPQLQDKESRSEPPRPRQRLPPRSPSLRFRRPPPHPPRGGLAGAGVGAVSARAASPKVRLLTSERPLLSMSGGGGRGTVWQRGYGRHRLLLDAGGVRAAAPA